MARKFDFDRYKAIVDYITTSASGISTSIEKLIDATIQMRETATASIIRYSTSITEIVIGKVKNIVETNSWTAEGRIKLHDNGKSLIKFSPQYRIEDDSMLPPAINVQLIQALSDQFIEKGTGDTSAYIGYDGTVTQFSGDDIPTLKFFLDNYVTVGNPVLGGKLIETLDSPTGLDVGINLVMAQKIAGVKLDDKTVNANTTKITTDIFSSDETGGVTSENSIENLVVSSGVKILNASTDKSVVLTSNIGDVAIRKDLSNMKGSTMVESQLIPESVLTDKQGVDIVTTSNPIGSDVATVSKTIEPKYAPDGLHPSVYIDTQAAKDIDDMLWLEDKLNGNDGVGDSTREYARRYMKLYGVVSDNFSPSSSDISSARGSTAVTLKHVYDMVASRLLMKNDELFVTNEQAFVEQQASSLYMKTTSSPEFARRPILMAAANEIGRVSDIKNIPASCESEEYINAEVASGWI